MKCLISIGLILPALAAVIGVAAWAVSADVVMNSGNNRGINRVENNLLQSYGLENDNRPDIFRMNGDRQGFQPRSRETPSIPSTSSSTSTSTTTITTTTTTTTTTPPPSPVPPTLSPKVASDVNAILSEIIAKTPTHGDSGPKFVFIAPLPDNAEALKSSDAQSGIERVDRVSTAAERPNENVRFHDDNNDKDLSSSASSQSVKIIPAPSSHSRPPKVSNSHQSRVSSSNSEHSNRMTAVNKEANRRISEKTSMLNNPNSQRRGFNPPTIEITGFEPFDSMMQSESVMGSQHHPPDSFSVGHGTFKRGPPPSHFGSRNPITAQHFDPKDQHIFNPRPEHSMHAFKVQHPPTFVSPGIGMKPIQQQLHHVESNAGPLQTSESNRWGTIGFPPSGYVHKPPEGISVSVSSPAHNSAHVSSEPVSVIKSFFLPFLPKPRLNMNARVVFGVVLDKGMGLGAKKETHHIG